MTPPPETHEEVKSVAETLVDEEMNYLEKRVSRLSLQKSNLQLILDLIGKASGAQGLENLAESVLKGIVDVIGGSSAAIYYVLDKEIRCVDVFGNDKSMERIEDEQVREVFKTRKPLEVESGFSDTKLLSDEEYTSAFTWTFPLLVGGELVGVIKLENLQIKMRELRSELPLFFSVVASLLKNEVSSRSELKLSLDRLGAANDELRREIEERERISEELRAIGGELESRVAERTSELLAANERLHHELEEREKAENALKAALYEIQDLYDQAPCGYHSLNGDGVFIRINETELGWLGYTREEVLGRLRFRDVLTEKSQGVFEEEFPKFKEKCKTRDFEFEIVRKDGTVINALLSASAITDRDGNFLMSRSSLFDLTERKKAETAEHLLSAIVQFADDAIFSKDTNGVILSWNEAAERMYGYTAAEAVGKNVEMLIPEAKSGEHRGIMETLLGGQGIRHFQTERKTKDGRIISVSLTVSPLRDSLGNITGASVVARDVSEQVELEKQLTLHRDRLETLVEQRTRELGEKSAELMRNQEALLNIVEDLNESTEELKQANEKLKSLDRMKSMFIASMSHELRTPLNSVIGFSAILRDGWLGAVSDEQRENLGIVHNAGKHLLGLINDVIDVSKIEAGKLEVRYEEFDLGDVVEEALRYVEREAHDKGIELISHVCGRRLFTDRRRLLQCILNLLANAVKFTEEGSVTISSTGCGGEDEPPPTPAGMVAVSVKDTGIGIDAGDIGKLFAPFVRLNAGGPPGTGLGLYLTKKLLGEVLGGEISCRSSAESGSTFTIKIVERMNENGARS